MSEYATYVACAATVVTAVMAIGIADYLQRIARALERLGATREKPE